MISVYLWLIFLSSVWIYLVWTRRMFYLLMLKLPGPMGFPLIGMALKLRRREEIIQTFYENQQKYGPLFVSWLGPVPFLVVSDPQIAQDILTSPSCVNKSFFYDALDDGTGSGLFSLRNPEWSLHRKLLNPAFSHGVLLSFIPIFNRQVNVLMDDIRLLTQGETDLTTTLQKFTLRIATLTTMGGESDLTGSDIQNQEDTLLGSYKCILEKMTLMCVSPWLRYKVVHSLRRDYTQYEQAKLNIRSFIRQMINRKLHSPSTVKSAKLESHNSEKLSNTHARITNKNCFINVAIDLLKRGEFTAKNVEDEANVIVLGAFETTSNTLRNTLMLLAMFPNYQQKVFEEIHTVFPGRDDFDVSYEDLHGMVYLDLVLNETMRLLTPVPIVARESSHELQLSNGVQLPRGLQIAIDIFNMHRRKDIWGEDANRFNPERFLPSHLEGRHSYAFIPFTKGIRNCIGWRYGLILTKITLARILRKYRVTTSFSFEDLQFVIDITLKLKVNPLLEFHMRTN